MRILVSGGGGFIGRRLVKTLLSEGHDVKVLDNFKFGGKTYFNDTEKKLEIVEADVRDYSKVREALKGIDLVYHLAAPSSFLMYEEDPVGSSTVTLEGFINIMEGMRFHKIKKIIYISTSAVYEGNGFPYVENMKISPPDLKALTKKFNEEAAVQYFQRYGIKTIGMRPFSVYGYGEETKKRYANIVSLFIWAMLRGERPVVWGSGRQTRDFIFVDDVVDALVMAQKKDFDCELFNLGTGRETSFNEVIRIINGNLGSALEPVYTPVPIGIYAQRLLANTVKQESVLGFKPKISIEEGICKTINYVKKEMKGAKKLSSCQLYSER